MFSKAISFLMYVIMELLDKMMRLDLEDNSTVIQKLYDNLVIILFLLNSATLGIAISNI